MPQSDPHSISTENHRTRRSRPGQNAHIQYASDNTVEPVLDHREYASGFVPDLENYLSGSTPLSHNTSTRPAPVPREYLAGIGYGAGEPPLLPLVPWNVSPGLLPSHGPWTPVDLRGLQHPGGTTPTGLGVLINTIYPSWAPQHFPAIVPANPPNWPLSSSTSTTGSNAAYTSPQSTVSSDYYCVNDPNHGASGYSELSGAPDFIQQQAERPKRLLHALPHSPGKSVKSSSSSVCSLCPARVKRPGDMIRHMIEQHERPPFECSECAYRTRREKRMQVHRRKKHGDQLNNEVYFDFSDWVQDGDYDNEE